MEIKRMLNRLKALKIYTLRALLNSRTNAPFISGDGFANICDVSVYSPMRWRSAPSRNKIMRAASIFIPGHRLDDFLVDYKESLTAKVLVVGNSDRDYFSLDFEIPDSVKLMLLQNSHVSHNSIETLPIGIENLRYGKNGFKKYFKHHEITKIDKVLVGPFSKTHPERDEIQLLGADEHERFKFLTKYVSPKELAAISREYAYIACPRGNGTDTHRFWETLYRGSIPIVKKSAWSASLTKHGLPFIEVESWSVGEIIEKIEKYRMSLPFNPKDIPALWLPYWDRVIKLNSK